MNEKRELHWVRAGYDPLTMERNEDWFMFEYEPINQNELATIEMLRRDLLKQQKHAEEEKKPDNVLIYGTREVMMLFDGPYVWDEEAKDFVKVEIQNINTETISNRERSIAQYTRNSKQTLEKINRLSKIVEKINPNLLKLKPMEEVVNINRHVIIPHIVDITKIFKK